MSEGVLAVDQDSQYKLTPSVGRSTARSYCHVHYYAKGRHFRTSRCVPGNHAVVLFQPRKIHRRARVSTVGRARSPPLGDNEVKPSDGRRAPGMSRAGRLAGDRSPRGPLELSGVKGARVKIL